MNQHKFLWGFSLWKTSKADVHKHMVSFQFQITSLRFYLVEIFVYKSLKPKSITVFLFLYDCKLKYYLEKIYRYYGYCECGCVCIYI